MGLLRISEAASLGLHAMAVLARQEHAMAMSQVAQTLNVSQTHLSKVCQRLVKAGLLDGQRGPKGGLTLARPSNQIRLLDIYEAIEGEMELCDCLLGRPMCHTQCVMGDVLQRVNREVSSYFQKTTLDQVSLSPEALANIHKLTTLEER